MGLYTCLRPALQVIRYQLLVLQVYRYYEEPISGCN